MIVNVRMIAHQSVDTVRPVTIADSFAHEPWQDLVDEVFYWGQNDFCDDIDIRGKYCSVSVGDVMELLPNINVIILPIGHRILSNYQYDNYKEMTKDQRADYIYGMYASSV